MTRRSEFWRKGICTFKQCKQSSLTLWPFLVIAPCRETSRNQRALCFQSLFRALTLALRGAGEGKIGAHKNPLNLKLPPCVCNIVRCCYPLHLLEGYLAPLPPPLTHFYQMSELKVFGHRVVIGNGMDGQLPVYSSPGWIFEKTAYNVIWQSHSNFRSITCCNCQFP